MDKDIEQRLKLLEQTIEEHLVRHEKLISELRANVTMLETTVKQLIEVEDDDAPDN